MADRTADDTTPSLLVVDGQGAGRRIGVPHGRWVVGRDEGCDIVVDDPGVSRRHARVTNTDGTVWVEDIGSTNGTWVDGERLRAPRRLSGGDEVRLGEAVLCLESRESSAQQSPTRPRRKVSLTRVALVGGLANLVLLAAGVLIQFLTDWTGIGPWLAAPLVGMVASLVEVGKESLTRAPPEPPEPPTVPRSGESPAVQRRPETGPPAGPGPSRRRAPVGLGILVAILVIGGGGLALAYGVGTVTSFITGNQSGTERLIAPVAQESQGVTVTVESVEQTRDFTRVGISVRNGLSSTITLPLFENATLRALDGTTLKADSFRSSWSDSIAPGQVSRGTVVFPGHLPDTTTNASFAFATIFEQGFEGPDSIVVDGLTLRQPG